MRWKRESWPCRRHLCSKPEEGREIVCVWVCVCMHLLAFVFVECFRLETQQDQADCFFQPFLTTARAFSAWNKTRTLKDLRKKALWENNEKEKNEGKKRRERKQRLHKCSAVHVLLPYVCLCFSVCLKDCQRISVTFYISTLKEAKWFARLHHFDLNISAKQNLWRHERAKWLFGRNFDFFFVLHIYVWYQQFNNYFKNA